jgi:hypothetical protein
MNNKLRFDVSKLKGKLSKIRDWMIEHHFPPRLLFILMGIASTIWFLIRVIPKPSRAGYPCMKVAAPFMSGFIIYLLSVGGLTFVSRRTNNKLFNVRYISTILLVFGVIVVMAVTPTSNTITYYQNNPTKMGPDDGPNQPVGTALGVNPGRVVWAWDPKATNENCTNKFDTKDWYFTPENTNREVVSKMFSESVKKLAGKITLAESWDQLFRYHNIKKSQKNTGYTKGEKIFIKINQTTSRGLLSQNDRNNGNFIPSILKPEEERKKKDYGAVETNPNIVLMLLRQLVNELGIAQSDIAVGDPQNPTWGHNYTAWANEFPNVVYVDRLSANHGRTIIHPTSGELIFYSDKTQSDKLYDIIENADYMINVSNFKPHAIAGITLSAKNHFGSQSRDGASHLHYSLIAAYKKGVPSNTGYHKYRVLVDIMGSKYLGKNTMLIIVDGLYGGGGSELLGPVKYFMPPFNNDWCNSIFMSQDQVAIESVCYDFLRTEWNGTYSHDPSNNEYNTMPNVNGVDDYLHQAADHSNWPAGIIYDPDNSGKPLSSLGVHEHWNNTKMKLYSRNLGTGNGIELVSIPESLVKLK